MGENCLKMLAKIYRFAHIIIYFQPNLIIVRLGTRERCVTLGKRKNQKIDRFASHAFFFSKLFLSMELSYCSGKGKFNKIVA